MNVFNEKNLNALWIPAILHLFEDFDKNHHFWSLITNLKLLKQQLNLQNSKCRVRDRGYIYYYEKKQKAFGLHCIKKDFSGNFLNRY
jgi:hypothetical protein